MFKLNRVKFIRNLVCTLLYLGMCVNLHAVNDPQELTFDDLILLDKSFNQPVEIRGFLYQQPNEQWILASQPNLKSCCLDNEKVVGTRLNVSWRSMPQASSLAVLLSGDLHIDSQDSKKAYQLENAEILPQANFSWPYAILLGCLLAASITFLLKKNRSHSQFPR